MNFGFTSPLPYVDIVETCPPESAELLRRLRQRSADAHALTVPHSELQEFSTARVLAETRLKRLTGHPQDGGNNLSEQHPSVKQAQRVLDQATADFKRASERGEAKAENWRATSAPIKPCEDWLRSGVPGGCVLEHHPVDVPKMIKGETSLLDVIERLRRRGRELKADQNRIASAQFPADYCKARLREMITQAGSRGEISVVNLVEHDGKLVFPMSRIQTTLYGPDHAQQVAYGEISDSVAMLCWLHGDQIFERLSRAIDAEMDPAHEALTHQEREQRNAEIAADLLDIERQEASAVFAAQDLGLPIEHRADCSPQAILQIRLVARTNGHMPQTSDMHAYSILR